MIRSRQMRRGARAGYKTIVACPDMKGETSENAKDLNPSLLCIYLLNLTNV